MDLIGISLGDAARAAFEDLMAQQTERVLGCADIAILDRWIRKAVFVASAEELFID